MPGNITSANAVLLLSVPDVFPAAVQLQGFSTDDIFDTPSVKAGETRMGVDGILSAGFTFSPTPQNYTLEGNSPSVDFFEQWYAAEQAQGGEKFFANGTVQLPAIGKSYKMTNGVLIDYSPMSDGKKTLQPRKFGIVWETVTAANL